MMLSKNSRLRTQARYMLRQHKWAQGTYRMLKSPLFWSEIGHVRKWWLLNSLMGHTMVTYERLSSLYDISHQVARSSLSGAFVECGVWRGGCAALMAYAAHTAGSSRKVHLFDSFEGLPQPVDSDGEKARHAAGGHVEGKLSPIGMDVADEEVVRRLLFERFGFDPLQVILHKGWFQHTLPANREAVGEIAILRLDGDWYESTRVCLENLYDNVVSGGFIIIDDYGWWEGCKKATDEFIQERGLRIELIYDDHACVHFRKPAP